MKKFLTIALLLVAASAASGQTNSAEATDQPICSMTAAQAPDIKGLKLGMTPEQVLALFPGSAADGEVRAFLSRPATPLGLSEFKIIPDKYASKAKFAGIRQITFTLMDGQVLSFSIVYDGPEWKHVDDFVAKVTEKTNLPAPDAWEAQLGLETQLKLLKCKDFELSVFSGRAGSSPNYVQMEDTAARRKLKERRAKAREKAAAEAKP